jgi:hypothetical protein
MFVELDRRLNDGLDIALEWDADSGQTQIVLQDIRSDSLTVFGVAGENAADAFWHPFTYLAQERT